MLLPVEKTGESSPWPWVIIQNVETGEKMRWPVNQAPPEGWVVLLAEVEVTEKLPVFWFFMILALILSLYVLASRRR